MKNFKEIFQRKDFNKKLFFPSVSTTLKETGHILHIRFDSKDVVVDIGYEGKTDPWLGAVCSLLMRKTLNEALHFTWKTFDEAFKADQMYWDMKQEMADAIFFPALEILRAALDQFRGREYLYEEASPLICRCFGVRESDVLEHLNKEAEPTLDTLTGLTKAGMGCRSCVPQLKRWLAIHAPKNKDHFYKDRSRANWLLEIDYMLSCFPESLEWKMSIESFKGHQVIVSYNKTVSQKELEEVGKRLQDFLGASTDEDLGFFLRAARD